MAKVTGTTDKGITYWSSNLDVAEVSSSGLVKATGTGEAKIASGLPQRALPL
ncbi:MAG: Ig-like domain-containing protein [Alloprevotella sp.]|nr:Ig-like domain-containing protein [Alloprevotella sp.]